MKQAYQVARKAAALGVAAFSLCTQALAAPEPLALAQTGKWIANFDKESCQLITDFGTGEDIVHFRLSRYSPADFFSLEMVSSHFPRGGIRGKVELTFGPGGSPQEVAAINALSGKLPMLILENVDLLNRDLSKAGAYVPITPEQEKAVKWLDITPRNRKPIRLMLGSMARPFAVMRTCMDTLLTSWGYEPAALRTIVSGPVPKTSPRNWLQSGDYPSTMLQDGEQALIAFRLDIDPQGQPTGCHILRQTGQNEFSDISCKMLMKRARFEPAVDKSGAKVKSFYMDRILWLMS